LVVEYYDSRNFPADDRAETFVSISYDDGNTWTDYQISDVGQDWSGLSYSTPGMDYIQVDVYHGLALPVWSDNRASAGGDFRAYTNPFEIPCPQNLDLIYGNYDIFDQGAFTYDAAYSAVTSINVAGGGSTYKVNQGAEVLMTAGDEIVLNDGFESEGEFYAYTGSCPNGNFSQRNQQASNNNESNSPSSFSPVLTDASNNFPVRVFPNPSVNGKVNSYIPLVISDGENKSEHAPAIISIYNSMGEEIYQSKASQSISEIDLSSQPQGLYMIKVVKGDKVYNGKIVLQ